MARSQSWNSEDMKHYFQTRLTGIEKGKETGFTESDKMKTQKKGSVG
jgi:hypothetical protein